ncbi:MAG: MFS transporter, partial [Rhizobiales bacterium]|nr:MFS transporter [Hyphomicrobiales bacterium]
VLIGYTAFRMSRRPAPRDVPRDAFQSMPPLKNATPETIALDPRAEDGKPAQTVAPATAPLPAPATTPTI